MGAYVLTLTSAAQKSLLRWLHTTAGPEAPPYLQNHFSEAFLTILQ